MTTSTHRPRELHLHTRLDPLSTMERILHAVPDTEDVVVYEGTDSWYYAQGVLAEIQVDARHVRRVHGTECEIRPWHGDPLPLVAEALRELGIPGWRAYGWAGFELAYAKAGMPELLDGTWPLLHLIVPRTEMIISGNDAVIRGEGADTIREALARDEPAPRHEPKPLDPAASDGEHYRTAVAAAVSEIEQNRLQKVILSREVEVGYDVDLVASYVLGRRNNQPARSFLLRMGNLRAAGFSPETVVEVSADGEVRSQPLAGTRAMTADAVRNSRLRQELLTDPKEIHEHAISVKAVYDELLPLCEPGSTLVENFMAVKERGTVQHLGSQVTGRLRAGQGPWDAFAAVFPGVTASGIPKKAAYRTIRRHERSARGLYSGAVLTVAEDGSMDAALVLRSLYQRDGRTWLRAGAGIVRQSRPEREFEETCEKLSSVAGHLVPRGG
ncbi:salicylate synthase [Amycolatopsis sp. NPDC059021]|uniref:salicylate synthase n=1 Tax=Amycolatopsis sp. NPDC059021 TaxID=3346704 RepID=UPI00366EE92A